MIRCPERMAATLLVLFAGLSAAVSASTFEVKNGVRYFDIVIAYEGTDDVADKEKFSRVLPHFAYGIYQCSQGRHKLRKVKIFSKPSKDGGVDNYTPKANACDVRWATTANTWPRATVGADITVGVSDAIIKGEHRGRIEFSDKPIKGKNTSFDLTGDGYKSNYETRLAGAALAHEWGHYHYCLHDEYPEADKGFADTAMYNRLLAEIDLKEASYNAAESALNNYKPTHEAALSEFTPFEEAYTRAKTEYEAAGAAYNAAPSEENGIKYNQTLEIYRAACERYKVALAVYSPVLNEYNRLIGNYNSAVADVSNATANYETYLYTKLSLMNYENGYAFEWFRNENDLIEKKKTEGETPVDSACSWMALCFSASPFTDGYNNVFTRQYSDNRPQLKPSRDFVKTNGYIFNGDFAKMPPSDVAKPFSGAIDSLEIVWNPADFVAVVIDNSGSMSGNRIANAKAAASELVDALPDGTKLGIYVFSSSASTIYSPQLLDDDARTAAKSAIDGIRANGGTRIGSATEYVLQPIGEQLKEADIEGSIVYLLSDGESSDNALSSAETYAGLNVPIYTFGYGSSTSGDLPKLAARTGAKYWYTPSGAAVRKAFQEAASFAGGRGQGASGTIRSGGKAGSSSASSSTGESVSTERFSKSFAVDSTMPDLRLTIIYNVNTPSVAVADPFGNEISPSDVNTVGSEVTATYEIAAPVIGNWTISGEKLIGSDISYFYDSSAVVDGYRLTARAEKVSAVAVRPRVYKVSASLCKAAAIDGAVVTGVLTKDGVEIDVFALENVSHGAYEAYVTVNDDPTTLSLSVSANNISGKAVETFKGITYEGGETPADIRITENFRRSVSLTFTDDSGEVIYVDASRSGDSSNGTTWATAKKTIQAAIDAVATNGIIIVTNGTYSAIVTRNKPLTIKSVEGWEKTVITGEGRARCADLGTEENDHASVLVGFRLIEGEAGAGNGGGARGGKLVRCRVERCHAASGGGVFNSLLEDCIIAFNTADVSGGGVKDGGLRGSTIYGNSVASDGAGGGIDGCSAFNSIIWGNTNATGGASNCADSNVQYCCTTSAQECAGNIASDPMFTDAPNGDFTLCAGSPCVDSGDAAFSNETTDGLGSPREMGGGLDMGACERMSLPAAPLAVSASDGLSTQHVAVVWGRSADAARYVVYRAQCDLQMRTVLASGVAGTCFIDKSAQPGVKYVYTVAAVNAAGMGPESAGDVGWISAAAISEDGVTSDIAFYEPLAFWTGSPILLTSIKNGNVLQTVFDPGDTIYLNYGFRNSGDGAAVSNFVNTFTLYRESVSWNSITDSWRGSVLPENGWGWFGAGYAPEFLQGLEPGEYTLACRLNADGSLAETDSANNVTSVAFRVRGPNLSVVTASVSRVEVQLGETVAVHWRIENLGELAAKATKTEFEVYRIGSDAKLVKTAWIDCAALASGGGREYVKTFTGAWLGGEGEYCIWIAADGKGAVREGDELDNGRLVYVKVVANRGTRKQNAIDWQFHKLKGEPDSFYLSTSAKAKKKTTTFKVGQKIYMRCGWWNATKSAVNGTMRVDVFLNGRQGIYYERTGFTRNSWYWGANRTPDFLQNLPAGKYTLTAALDSKDGWWETNEKNNIRQISFTVVGTPTIYGEEVYTCALRESVSWPVSSEGTVSVKGLPPGLKYSGGAIVGKATKVGNYSAKFTSKNAAGTKTRTIKIVVTNPGFDVSVNVRANGATGATFVAPGETVPMFIGVVQNITIASTPGKDGVAKSAASSVSVKGLPPGLKYSKGVISGVPSKTGTYTVKFTFKNSLGWSKTFSMKMAVKSLPAWARGTFYGWSYYHDDSVDGGIVDVRKVTFSVTSAGKISAKVGALSFSRTGWTVDESGSYVANMRTVRTTGSGKSKKTYTDVLSLTLAPNKAWTDGDQLTGTVFTFNGNVAPAEAHLALPINEDIWVSARRNSFGDNAEAKALAQDLAALGTLKMTDGDGIVWSIKVAANGIATISRVTGTGKNKKTISATAAVEWNGDEHSAPYAMFLVSGNIVGWSWTGYGRW